MSFEVQNIRKVYQGKIFSMAVESVAFPDGTIKDREVVRHPGAAAMVPLFDNGEVALIKQYRHAVGAFLWEIPAGTLEPHESPLACARRELAEETGFEAKDLVEVTQILPAPGYTDECIHIFLATGLTPVQQRLDDDEVLKVQPTPLDRALEMIREGKIQDAKTITGLLLIAADQERQG
jgi:ADP-ribose pyrophosphatase